MNAEKFVRGRLPGVRLKTIKCGKNTYYAVKSQPSYTLISVGKTRDEAWNAAKDALTSNEPLCPA